MILIEDNFLRKWVLSYNLGLRICISDMHQAQRLKSLANWLANWGVKITGPMVYII